MHKEKYNNLVIDGMAQAQGKIMLAISLYHCELNPIEQTDVDWLLRSRDVGVRLFSSTCSTSTVICPVNKHLC